MPILLVKPLPLLKLPGSRLMIDGVDRPGRSSVLHPEPPDRDDGLRVLGEIEVGPDRACDIAVEPEDMVVPRERARCRRAVQPLRRQNVQHHRGDRLDTTTAPIRPGYRIVGIERRVRHRRRDVGHHRPQRHVVRAELPDRGVERCYVALVVGAAMPQPDRVPELMDQGVIEIVAVCESRAERSGIALGVGLALDIERDEGARPGNALDVAADDRGRGVGKALECAGRGVRITGKRLLIEGEVGNCSRRRGRERDRDFCRPQRESRTPGLLLVL